MTARAQMQIRTTQPLILLRESASGARFRTTTPAPVREVDSTDDASSAYKMIIAKCFEKLGFKVGDGESFNDAGRRVMAELFDDAAPMHEAAHQPTAGGGLRFDVDDDAPRGRRLRESLRGVKVTFNFDDDARLPTVLGPGPEVNG